jgi:hypothetical protein
METSEKQATEPPIVAVAHDTVRPPAAWISLPGPRTHRYTLERFPEKEYGMSEEDPLAELSAAAKKRYVPGRLPRAAVPGHGMHSIPHRPYQKQSNPYLVPILIAIGLLAVGIPAGIIITYKLLQPPPPPPVTRVIIKDPPRTPQPGELYKKVDPQDTEKPRTPPPPSDE